MASCRTGITIRDSQSKRLKYDYSKTKWFNQQHLRIQTDQAIFDNIIRTNSNLLTKFPKDYIINTIALVKERAVFESDIIKEGAPFFSDKIFLPAKNSI